MNKCLTENDFLHAEGRYLKTRAGETVFLCGTNLGGWLLQEEWMASFSGADSQWELLHLLESRFGRERADALIARFEDNFITEADVERLANAGFNCLRVPFWYGNLYTDDCGTRRLTADGKPDFSRLDWICEECRKRGMYVILDLHGVPGHQSIAHHSCRTNHCELYDSSPRGDAFRATAAALWREVAAHFRDRPEVAAYDLMNEPMCDYHGKEKEDGKYHAVYDLLYRAVREKDTRHVIAIEGIWTPFDLPKPVQYGWKNVMYEYHLYLPDNLTYTGFVPLERLRRFSVPVFIGEFASCRGKADWSHIFEVFRRADYHWCTWTYKGHSKWGPRSEWFLFASAGEEKVVDLQTASYEELWDAWGEKMRTENSFLPMNDLALFGALSRKQQYASSVLSSC